MRLDFENLSTRRGLLGLGGAVFVVSVFGESKAAAQALTVSKQRRNWRFCRKCQVMFYMDRGDGLCAADGKRHIPQGYNFFLPFDVPATSTAQNKWYCCKHCRAMFFNGYAQKGRCPGAPSAHEADRTFQYVLPHGLAGTPKSQNQWRFCSKCFAMFFNGYPGKGVCAADKQGHVAQGYDFVLPHDIY
jgi:hypothetical protein